jgi:hypothetical protein
MYAEFFIPRELPASDGTPAYAESKSFRIAASFEEAFR